MLEQLSSNSFNKIFKVSILLFLLLVMQGCLQVRTRISTDISKNEINSKIGGPYYVVDITGEFHTSRKIKSSELLHNECQDRYPTLFSKSKDAIPIIVSRCARTTHGPFAPSWQMLLSGLSCMVLPYSSESRIEENISLDVKM